MGNKVRVAWGKDTVRAGGRQWGRAPVRADVAPATLAFPFNQRPLLAFWNALFLRPAAYGPDAARSAWVTLFQS